MPDETHRPDAAAHAGPGKTVTDELRTLCVELSNRLWAVHRADDTGPRLIFPTRRSGIVRVSEQESRILFCELLEHSSWFYSVESPTIETYQQLGNTPMSGRTDVSLYSSRRPDSKRANVELKAHGGVAIEGLRKDLEKVLREDVDALWFHTLENTDRGTLPTLFAKLRDAFALLDKELAGRARSIVFAFCVLKREELWLMTLALSGPADEQLLRIAAALDPAHLVQQPPGAGWSVHRRG